MKKIAIIEIGGSHHECIYAQLEFLKSPNTEITLICSSNLKADVEHFSQVKNFHFIDYSKGEWRGSFAIRRILNTNNYSAVVINTAHGKRVRNLLLFPFKKKQNFTGILHNTKKLEGSGTQKIITKGIKKYFVLAQYLLQSTTKNSAISVQYFYPSLFPAVTTRPLQKGTHEIWIGIPGQVEYKRRDYTTLFNQIKTQGLSPHIKLIFLGKSKHLQGDGAAVEQQIKELKIEAQCQLWDGYVDATTFESYIQECDYLLPLIHPHLPELSNYFTHQISGTFNIAIGYHKQMLLEETYSNYPDFLEDGIFYTQNNLVKTINSLGANKKKNLYTSARFSFKEQKKKYVDLLFG